MIYDKRTVVAYLASSRALRQYRALVIPSLLILANSDTIDANRFTYTRQEATPNQDESKTSSGAAAAKTESYIALLNLPRSLTISRGPGSVTHPPRTLK